MRRRWIPPARPLVVLPSAIKCSFLSNSGRYSLGLHTGIKSFLAAILVMGTVCCMATSARKPPSPPAPSKNAELGSKGAAKREDAGSRVQTAPASKPGGKSATSVATAPESPSDGTDIGTPRDASPGTPGAATESTVLATGASRQERAGE